MSLACIARKLGKPEGTVRRWKSTQKWDVEECERSETKTSVRKDNRTKTEKAIAEEVKQVIENPDLTDKQRLFCLYYIRCFNATKAYQKAYGVDYSTAASIGYRLLEKDGVRVEIQRLKQNRLNREMLSESDIFQKYMDIAFADITDYVEFGREKIPVMTMYGPLKEKDEETGETIHVMKEINTVRFKESSEVDGTIIREIKQGKDGASIKLADQMQALKWIADHMDMATEEQKVRIEVMRAKAQLDETEEIADDGFLEALSSSAAEDWSDEED